MSELRYLGEPLPDDGGGELVVTVEVDQSVSKTEVQESIKAHLEMLERDGVITDWSFKR